MYASSYQFSTKSSLELGEQLGGDLIARVPLYSPETTTTVVVIKQGPTGFFKLPQALLPCVDRVIFSLSQRFARNIVLSRGFGRIKISVVDSTGRFVHPA